MYNILIVDDERIERNGIIMLLKRLSINAGIVEAANGKEAYEYSVSYTHLTLPTKRIV